MPTFEHNTLRQYKDQNGDMHLDYPITKAENVVGLYGDAALTGVPTAPTAEKGTNTEQVATTAFVQTELSDIKKELSDGMTDVAAAITEKGVETATDATLAVMAANIRSISSGGNGVSLNIFTQLEEPDIKDGIWVKTGNGYEHIIVNNQPLQENGAWSSAGELPYKFYDGNAFVFNNEIHIIGGTESNVHYKFDGTSWTYISSLPINNNYSCGVIYRGEIHIFFNTRHYKFDGTSWTSVSTHDNFGQSYPVVYNDKIYVFMQSQYLYIYDGAAWSRVSIDKNGRSGAVVYKGIVYIVIGKTMYKLTDNLKLVSCGTLPVTVESGHACLIIHNGEIHMLGSSSNPYAHYKYDGTSWTSVSTIPYYFYSGAAVSYNLSIRIIGGNDVGGSSPQYNKKKFYQFLYSENMFDKHTVILQRGDHNGTYLTTFVSTPDIIGDHNRFVSGFDDVFYFDETSFDWDAQMYYGDGTQWIKFKN